MHYYIDLNIKRDIIRREILFKTTNCNNIYF